MESQQIKDAIVALTLEPIDDEVAAQLISIIVNEVSRNPTKVAKIMARDHPTLQQNKMRLFVAYVEQMAQIRYTDDRNDAAVAFAKKVMTTTTDRDRYFPHV